jgi:hypothetical protein
MVCVSLPTDGGIATIISAYTPSAVGSVAKYLVAIEMPRVRFPDGTLTLPGTFIARNRLQLHHHHQRLHTLGKWVLACVPD